MRTKSGGSRMENWRIDAAGLAAAGGIALLVVMLQVLPAMERVRAHGQLMKELGDERQKLTERRRAVQTLHGQVEQVERFIRENRLELRPADELNRRLTRLSELTAGNGLQLDVIEPGKPAAGAQYDSLPIKLSGQGGYRNVTKFLADMRKEMPDTAVTGFDLVGGADGGQGAGHFAFRLVWYSAPTGGDPARGGVPANPAPAVNPGVQASVPE